MAASLKIEGLDDLREITADFEPMITVPESIELVRRISNSRPELGVALALGSLDRASLLSALRKLAEDPGEGKSGAEEIGAMLDSVAHMENWADHLRQLLQVIQARLLVTVAELADRVEAERAGEVRHG